MTVSEASVIAPPIGRPVEIVVRFPKSTRALLRHAHRVGETVDVVLYRDGMIRDVEAVLRERYPGAIVRREFSAEVTADSFVAVTVENEDRERRRLDDIEAQEIRSQAEGALLSEYGVIPPYLWNGGQIAASS